MSKTLLLSVLVLPLWASTLRAAPRATAKAVPAAKAAPDVVDPVARCSPCPAQPPRELTLRLSASMGGFYSRTTHWIRTEWP